MLVCGLVGETGQHGQHPLGLKLMGVIYKTLLLTFRGTARKFNYDEGLFDEQGCPATV